jgi:hypothetical protein
MYASYLSGAEMNGLLVWFMWLSLEYQMAGGFCSTKRHIWSDGVILIKEPTKLKRKGELHSFEYKC